jgi:hypothetical protein
LAFHWIFSFAFNSILFFFASNFCVHLKSQRCFQKFFPNFCFQLKPLFCFQPELYLFFQQKSLLLLLTWFFVSTFNCDLYSIVSCWNRHFWFQLKSLLSLSLLTYYVVTLYFFFHFFLFFSLSTRFPPVCVWVGCQVFWQKLFLIRLLVINSICGFLKLQWFQVKVQLCNSETFNLFLFGI